MTNEIESDTTTLGYQQRLDDLESMIAELEAGDDWLTRSRAVMVFATLFFLIAAALGWGAPQLGWILSAVSFAVLVGIAGWHESRQLHLKQVKIRRELQRHQLARYRRQWQDVPPAADPAVTLSPHEMATFQDLDVSGHASMLQWICRAHTPAGRERLCRWLIDVPSAAEIEQRQEAAQQLAPMTEMRHDLELHGKMLLASDTGPAAFVEWAEQPTRFSQRTMFNAFLRVMTLLMLALPFVIWFGWLPPEWTLLGLAILALNVIINAFYVGEIHELFNQITAGHQELVHYGAMFEIVDGLDDRSLRLAALRQKMQTESAGFRTALEQLRRIMKLGSGRRSSTFGIPYVVVQLFFYWDFHIVVWLEKWQRRYGDSVRHWFDAVGELEALSSLAAVAADHPEWAFPQVTEGSDLLAATELGHPLLPPDKCTRNDVQLGPPGTFLLVTGSNMSGKSTLLRSVGTNVLLAQAGAPVCARHFSLPICRIATSMRVTDSLEDGISFFMAELKRLKEIVDRADQTGPPERLLFLLDEILQGTNSAERHIAVARIIGKLIGCPAIGAVSTHDLELAGAPELAPYCQTVHFREHFDRQNGERKMTFDYQLREGVSPTTNALKLLELVGLE